MLKLKQCNFCGREFRCKSASNQEFCPDCSPERRDLAVSQFSALGGGSNIYGNYLLSPRQSAKFGLRPG